MTDERGAEDLSLLFRQRDNPIVRYGQGVIDSWDPDTLSNRVLFRGTTLIDLPILSGVEALGYQAGDAVGLLGADFRGKGGIGSWWILGKILVPGTDPADIIIKGSSIILEGGELLVRDTDGDLAVRIGRTEAGGGEATFYHPNGTILFKVGQLNVGEDVVGYGMFMQKDNEEDVFGAGPLTAGAPYQFIIRDDSNNITFSTSGSGVGLHKPYLEVPMYCPRSVLRTDGHYDTPWVFDINNNPEGAAINEWINLWSGRMWATHPGIFAQCRLQALAGAGQIRLTVDDVVVGSTETAGSPATVDFGGPQNLPGSLDFSGDTFYQVAIQVRATNSSGRILAVPYGVNKRGSV